MKVKMIVSRENVHINVVFKPLTNFLLYQRQGMGKSCGRIHTGSYQL